MRRKLRGGETIAFPATARHFRSVREGKYRFSTPPQAALQNVQGATANINDISAKINHGQGTVGALINDKTIYNQAAASVTSMDEDMDALKHNFLLRGFFNKRGYVDSDQLKKHEIAKLPARRRKKRSPIDPSKSSTNPTRQS